jgi:hypothetical protein
MYESIRIPTIPFLCFLFDSHSSNNEENYILTNDEFNSTFATSWQDTSGIIVPKVIVGEI